MTAADRQKLAETAKTTLYAALKHEKSCTCGECSGGLNAVDDLFALAVLAQPCQCDVSTREVPPPHERDYIERTIATVRVHQDADNCWPQWANIFADQIEWLEAEVAALRKQLAEAGQERDGYLSRLDASVVAKQQEEVQRITAEQKAAALEATLEQAREALREIAKGEGRFSVDRLEHAENTIEDMKALALRALAAVDAREETNDADH